MKWNEQSNERKKEKKDKRNEILCDILFEKY